MTHEDRLTGALLGTALGDALGLPAEGMAASAITRRFGVLNRFRLLGTMGIVSDDTEQAALVAAAVLGSQSAAEAARRLERSLAAWICCLPWGVGRATLLACGRSLFRLRPTGVQSAGNGAAMRAGSLGVIFVEQAGARREYGEALAQVTHRDPRAVQGALFVAEVAAGLARGLAPDAAVQEGLAVLVAPGLRAGVVRALELATEGASRPLAAQELGITGFVQHTVAFAAYCLLRQEGDPLQDLASAISAGGDTDSIGAILGCWLGTQHGADALPRALLDRIQDGPFGPTHLRALARALAQRAAGEEAVVPDYSAAYALIRNLLLYPVILAHGFRRLLP